MLPHARRHAQEWSKHCAWLQNPPEPGDLRQAGCFLGQNCHFCKNSTSPRGPGRVKQGLRTEHSAEPCPSTAPRDSRSRTPQPGREGPNGLASYRLFELICDPGTTRPQSHGLLIHSRNTLGSSPPQLALSGPLALVTWLTSHPSSPGSNVISSEVNSHHSTRSRSPRCVPPLNAAHLFQSLHVTAETRLHPLPRDCDFPPRPWAQHTAWLSVPVN